MTPVAESTIKAKYAISSGTVTWNDTAVTGDTTRKIWVKLDRIVTVGLEFTPKTTPTNNTVICTGLPIPLSADQCIAGHSSHQVRINGSGSLVWYFPVVPSGHASDRIDLNMTYVARE